MVVSAGGRRIPVSLAYLRGGDSLCVSMHRRGWQKCLKEHCAELKGYRVVWRKDGDPYLVKLMKSAQRQKTTRLDEMS